MDTGDFAFPDLPVGAYTVEINAAGFTSSDNSGVNVEIGHITRLDVALTKFHGTCARE